MKAILLTIVVLSAAGISGATLTHVLVRSHIEEQGLQRLRAQHEARLAEMQRSLHGGETHSELREHHERLELEKLKFEQQTLLQQVDRMEEQGLWHAARSGRQDAEALRRLRPHAMDSGGTR